MKKEFTSIEGAAHAAMPPTKAKFAFTLAEVLITLGIIGVVAAMTIPTLMANMTGTRYRSQFKKAVSTLSQAARLNKANYGWDFSDVNENCGFDIMSHTSEEHMSVCAIFNSNLSSKQGIYRENILRNSLNYKFNGEIVGVTSTDVGEEYSVYILSDGTLVGVRSFAYRSGCSLPIGKTLNDYMPELELKYCTGFIDVNGFSLPNEETKCSVGTTTKAVDTDCIVKNKDMKDVFPIVFHDDIVEGATNAAKYVLQTTK